MIYNASANDQSLSFSNIQEISFAPISALGASVVIGTIQDVLPVPFDCKVVRATVAFSGTPSGTVSFNVVTGVGAAATLPDGTNDTNSPSGTALFAVSPTIYSATAQNAAGVDISFTPDVPNAIYACTNPAAAAGITGYPFTLRLVTAAASGITGITKVTLAIMPINQHMQATLGPSPDNVTGWDPSAF